MGDHRWQCTACTFTLALSSLSSFISGPLRPVPVSFCLVFVDFIFLSSIFKLGFQLFIFFLPFPIARYPSLSVALFLTCLFYFVLAILYEVLKAYRRVVALRSQINQTARIVRSGSIAQRQNAESKIAGISGCGGDNSAGSSLSAASSHNGHQKLVHSGASTYIVDPSSPVPDDPTTMVATIQPINSSSNVHPSYGISDQANIQVNSSVINDTMTATSATIPIFSAWEEMFSVAHFTSTLLYMLQVIFAYLLMLAFMLFNVWICLAILFGAGVGHFLLAQKAIALQDSANEDYCH